MKHKSFTELIELVKNGTAEEMLAAAEEIKNRIKALESGGDRPPTVPPNP